MNRRVIVNYSGGAGSFCAAERAVIHYGADGVILVCADTKSEADDWYDFVAAGVEYLDVPLIMLADGRDIWQLAEDNHAIPSNRMPFCSRVLKRELIAKWIANNYDNPEDTIRVFGFDYLEQHRLTAMKEALAPAQVLAPLCWEPLLDKTDCLERVQALGLPYPKAYSLGLPHNNCLKYGCVRGGKAYWQRLLRAVPESYARSEEAEERLRDQVGDYAILYRVVDGVKQPLPLRQLRLQTESQPELPLGGDYGSCACWA